MDGELEETAQRGVSSPIVEKEGQLRARNQVTIPSAVARRLGLEPGDRLIFIVNEGEPDEIHVPRVRAD